jgi:hypothetical protein
MPHKGVCVGGPMAGLTITTRSEVGFVAVDKPASAAWLYRADTNGRFVLDTGDDPSRIDEDGTRALDLERLGGSSSECLDVIAVPGEDDEDEFEPAAADLGPDPGPLVLEDDDEDEGGDY